MLGCVLLETAGMVAHVTISHPVRFNAMSRHMWRELRAVFEHVQHNQELRCVLIRGAGSHFCAGGDISEYATFRFQEDTLRDFHENDVWGGLQAMLDCDVPIVAHIEGNCMGAGVEIASCCDVRLSAASARFGAPIAKLGFPMAPREAALVTRELGLGKARQMLLEAALFSAADLHMSGFLSQVWPDDELAAQVKASAQRITQLAPQAARINKQTLRVLSTLFNKRDEPPSAVDLIAKNLSNPYAYADSAEHREGVAAFMEKRKPEF